jgi:hypothetical protein
MKSHKINNSYLILFFFAMLNSLCVQINDIVSLLSTQTTMHVFSIVFLSAIAIYVCYLMQIIYILNYSEKKYALSILRLIVGIIFIFVATWALYKCYIDFLQYTEKPLIYTIMLFCNYILIFFVGVLFTNKNCIYSVPIGICLTFQIIFQLLVFTELPYYSFLPKGFLPAVFIEGFVDFASILVIPLMYICFIKNKKITERQKCI